MLVSLYRWFREELGVLGCLSRNCSAPAATVRELLKATFSSVVLALLEEEHSDGNLGQPCEMFSTQGQCFRFLLPQHFSITAARGQHQPQSS